MERSSTIILILICISMYDVLFSGGEWIEVNGCHSLQSSTIQNQTSLPANEPGACLKWCGTEVVALQNSSCLCFDDSHNMTKMIENSCSQNCSGNEKLKCGGNSSQTVSVYRGTCRWVKKCRCSYLVLHTDACTKERTDVGIEWTSLHNSGCLTYSHNMGETGEKLMQEDCTVKHPFHCYSEITSGPNNCNDHADLNNIKTWYEALEACTSPFHSYLWPAHNTKTCNWANIQSGQFWVAVYWWTKVIPTSTTSSTTITTSSATSTTSSMLSTITMSGSTTSTSYITSSALTTTETSSESTMSSPLSISGTSSRLSATTLITATTSSPSTSTSVLTKLSNKWTNKKFTYFHESIPSKNQSAAVSITTLTNASSISMTTSTSHSTKLMPTPGSHASTHVSNTLRSEMSSFKIDSPNIGLGIAIGVLAGFLISITIAYCRRRICTRESSRNMDHSYNSYL